MSLPEPLTPVDCDLRGYEYMPLFGQRLFGSELYMQCSAEEFRVAIRLWWAAWQQCPAGSLPAADAAQAMLADYGRDLKGWSKVRDAALRGFVLCSDGRLYHPVLADAAVKAFDLRLKSDTKRASDRKRLQDWRDAKKKRGSDDDGNTNGNQDETRFTERVETPDETLNVGGRREEEKRKEERKEETPVRPPAVSAASDASAKPPPTREASPRGNRLPDDWQPDRDDILFASQLGLAVADAAAEFRDYWHAVPGNRGKKLDWSATWRNRCRERASRPNAPQARENAALRRIREQDEALMRLVHGDDPRSGSIDHEPQFSMLEH